MCRRSMKLFYSQSVAVVRLNGRTLDRSACINSEPRICVEKDEIGRCREQMSDCTYVGRESERSDEFDTAKTLRRL